MSNIGRPPHCDDSIRSARWRHQQASLAGRPHPRRQKHYCPCQTSAQSNSTAEARQQQDEAIDALPPVAQRPRHVAIIMVRCC